MEEEARKRKEKLEELRKRKNRPATAAADDENARSNGGGGGADAECPPSPEGPVLKFRNYTPRNPDLSAHVRHLDPSTTGEDAGAETNNGTLGLGPTVETRVKDLAKTVVAEGEANWKSGDVDLLSLVPKKPNWDLKRNLEPKLEKLERQTKRAIAEMIHQRLRVEGVAGGSNFLDTAERTRKEEQRLEEEELEA